jgi:hypothetical protein
MQILFVVYLMIMSISQIISSNGRIPMNNKMESDCDLMEVLSTNRSRGNVENYGNSYFLCEIT